MVWNIVTNGNFGNTNKWSIQFILSLYKSWNADVRRLVDGNFITILIDGIDLINSEQRSGFPKIEEGAATILTVVTLRLQKLHGMLMMSMRN